MALFSTSHYFILLTFLILFLKIHAFHPLSSFSFTGFEKDPKFESSLALYGNANVINGGSEVLLSSGSGSSRGSGKIMSKKPIKLAEVIVFVGLKSGEKLHAWIDYEASSRRLEVRLSQYDHSRPSDPMLWHTINFSNLWKAKEMFVGFSPVKSDSSEACSLYSWSFILRHLPYWMHSEPLDPKHLAIQETVFQEVKPRSDCLLRILAAMIFGAGCGALTAFIMLYVWTIFGNSRPVVPEEYVMQPIECEYKKVNVVVEKAIKDAQE
ncbi:putative non-specific serine/threonine protein kinase [Lupinus albus]|uniref:Putative non-specific serine/threonine protein kinase n=1 Tax=Lupinus albus TaxID=3870 RepID=A0A6A4NW54_LUPAL|nr:putative non-specific serine/threonine protein kinase [Lupinus albus]